MNHLIHYSSLFTRVNIYFEEDKFFATERHELYGWVDFIANCGGLVGLFMGCSMLTFIETVYYILLYKSKKDDQTVNLNEDSRKETNRNKDDRFIQVSCFSDEWKRMSKIEYLP